MKTVLLTGGLGYIGSHVAVELISAGYTPVIFDDLSNSELFVLDNLRELTGTQIPFIEGDIRDAESLSEVFRDYTIEGVIHFAAKKAVGESMEIPLEYYDVNVYGLLNLLNVLSEFELQKLVFSSSCTVYGLPDKLPVTEQTPFGNTPSPYGKTKQICEEILKSVSPKSQYPITSLRYFNPVGAHPTGLIGELPKGVPNNLVPFVTQTAAGIRNELKVFGGDYNTSDGTAIRDYIHVVDLAKAHVKALEMNQEAYEALNVGTGKGYSVLEVVKSFIEVSGVELAYKVVDRREGDVEVIYGDTSYANEKLGWKAELGLKEMLKDAWRWQQSIPS